MAADDPTVEVRDDLNILRGDLAALRDSHEGCYQMLLGRVTNLEKQLSAREELPAGSGTTVELFIDRKVRGVMQRDYIPAEMVMASGRRLIANAAEEGNQVSYYQPDPTPAG